MRREVQRRALEFQASGLHRILELGAGQGRDSLFFAASGFSVHVLDYAPAGIDTILKNAAQAGLSSRLSAQRHGVRLPLPVSDATFDACYSHMLFCMAFTTAELEHLAREAWRALRPGGQCVYTARNTSDPDYGRGIHRGEDLYESNGFIVHYFDRAKVERLASGYDISSINEFEEGKLPRRLFRVVMRKR
jgi:SAM-dependent methyltransferase